MKSGRARLAAALLMVVPLTACQGGGGREPLAGDAHSQDQARSRAGVLLDRLYLPGAIRTTVEGDVGVSGGADDVVTAFRRFRVAGDAAGVVAGLQRRPPPGLQDTTPAFPATGTSVPVSSAELRPTGRRYSSMQTVQVIATDVSRGIASVEVRAVVGWIRPRTAVETLPADAEQVQLGIGYGPEADAALDQSRSLTPSDVKALADALNRLPSTSRSAYSSCFDPDIALAQLQASYAGHHVVFDIEIGGCNEVDVEVDGREQPLLADDQPVARVLAAITGLSLGRQASVAG